ncbi:MAG: LamG-like jellyroll fold domain-containing protein [Cyanophyceae cyanobacterium]
MSTEFISPNWRMPRNANQSKQANYSLHQPDQADFIESSYNINGLTQITVSCWIKTTQNNNNEHVWSFPKTGTDSGFALQTGSNNNGLGFKCNNYAMPSVVTVQDTTFNYADGNWHNVIISSSDTKFNMYINGVLKASTSITGAAMSGTIDKFFIGSFSNSNPQFNVLNVSFSDACIFDYALSDGGVSVGDTATGQIATLYGDSTNGPGNPMALPSPPIAYYPLGTSAWNGNFLAENNAIGDYVFGNLAPNDYVSLGNDFVNSTRFPDGFTMDCWVRNWNVTGNAQNVFINQDNGSTGLFSLYSSWANISDFKIWLNTGSGYQNASNSSDWSDNTKWVHLCAVWDKSAGTLVLYSNGQPGAVNSSAPTSWGSHGTGIQTSIGNTDAAGNLGLEISNVHFWNGPISSTEVETLYNYGSPIRTLANIPQSSNLKAWYKLDASEIYNSTTTEWIVNNQTANYKTALDFSGDGNNSGVQVASDLMSGYTNFTWSIWANAKAFPDAANYLFKGGSQSYLRESAGNLNFFINIGGTFTPLSVGFTSTDEWSHIVGVVDQASSKMKIYINGVLKATRACGSGTIQTSSPFVVGTDNGLPQYVWDGLLSNAQVWNTTLTDGGASTVGDVAGGEIATLYNSGTPLTSSIPQSSNNKLWLKMDNLTNGIQDSSGNNNNATADSEIIQVDSFVSTLNGESSGMSQTNLVQSDLQTVASYSKYAMNFDAGNADYIDLTSQIVLSSELTISCWIKSDGAVVYGITAGDNGSADSWYRFYPTHSGGNRVDIMIDGTSTEWNFANGGTPIQNGVWQHYLLKRDSSNKWTFYLDNVKYTTNQPTISGSFRVDTFCRIYSSSPRYFEGAMSNMAIWNTSLSDSQVREVYNQGLPSDLNSFSGTAPIHWWQLGEGSSYAGGWIFADEIGSINGEGQNIAETDLTNGVGTTANGVSTGMAVGDLVSDAPYSTGNAMSVNMSSTARGTNVP